MRYLLYNGKTVTGKGVKEEAVIIDSGRISLDDEVTISERASSMGGSQMYMEAGETHTVEELMKGVAMASANDGCVALAEYVAGTEEIFVERMNKRAEELGMRDTHFVNTNGLPVADHYSSAYDIAIMSMELYKHEKTREWFTTWQDTMTVGLPGKEKEFGNLQTDIPENSEDQTLYYTLGDMTLRRICYLANFCFSDFKG